MSFGNFESSGPAQTIPGTLGEFWEQVENECHCRRAVDISCSSGSKSRLVGPQPTEDHFGSSGPAQTIPGTLVEFWEQVENVCLTQV